MSVVPDEPASGAVALKASPSVSVIIPTYNRVNYIAQAIDSVRGQTFTDHEIIVVDDGSTDDTDAVVRGYGGAVRYVRTTHGGVARARNVGMEHSRGQFLTFLDSDDLLYPDALALQVALLRRFPNAGLTCAEMSGFDDRGFFERYHLKAYHHSAYRDPSVTFGRIFQSSMPLAEAVAVSNAERSDDPTLGDRRVYLGNVFDTYLLNLVLCQNSVMLRRSVVDAVGKRRERVKHWQEVDYLLSITRRHAVCFADVPTYKLRYHDGQVSTTAGPNGAEVWMRKQQGLLRVVKRHALADRDYYRSHRHQIDRHLAHLHRALAVPMLLYRGTASKGQRYLRYARRHLRRCAAYGHPARMLQLAIASPEPMRRLLVSTVETARQASWRMRAWRSPSAAVLS